MSKVATDYDRARKLLDIYRGEVDDYFKIWPRDKQFYFSADGKAFISYGIKGRVAACMGDPVGAPDSIPDLLKDFMQMCSNKHLTVAFIQTTDKLNESYRNVGLHNLVIGADAVIDLDDFMTKTMHNKYFRNLANRYTKQHYSFTVSSPPHKAQLIQELKQVSDSWLTLPHRKEWSFLTGRFTADYLNQVDVYVLRDADGVAQAFATELPSFKPGVATIDLMRHRADAPANCMDMVFMQLISHQQHQGYSKFNLGLSPLDGKPFAQGLAASSLMFVYRVSNSFIGFRGLHQFKAKYKPQWEPRYIWFGGTRRHNLQSIGLAIAKLINGS